MFFFLDLILTLVRSFRSLFFSVFLSLFSFSLVSFPSFDLKSRELRREVCGPFKLRHCVRPFSSLVHLVSLSLLVHVSTGSSSLPPFPSLVLLLTPFSLSLSLSLFLSPSPFFPLHLSVLLYTHCKDLGNEVDPPPRSAILRPPSFPTSRRR